jgi:hypothetical protein
MTLQQIGKWTTWVLWALCLGAILLVLYGTPPVKEISTGAANLAQIMPDVQSHDTSEIAVSKMIARPTKNATGSLGSSADEPLLFPGKTAFINHFKNSYAEAELQESYNDALARAGGGPGNPAVWVYPKKKPSNSPNFAGNYKVRLRFDIKPVPK